MAASGVPRPLRLQRSLNAPAVADGTLDFTDYDAPLAVTAPAGAIAIAQRALSVIFSARGAGGRLGMPP